MKIVYKKELSNQMNSKTLNTSIVVPYNDIQTTGVSLKHLTIIRQDYRARCQVWLHILRLRVFSDGFK